MPKFTYVLVDGEPGSNKKPYSLYRYANTKSAKKDWFAKREAVIYTGPTRLAQLLSLEDLQGIWVALDPENHKDIKQYGPVLAAQQVHNFMIANHMQDVNGELENARERTRYAVRREKAKILKPEVDAIVAERKAEAEKQKKLQRESVKMAVRNPHLSKEKERLRIKPIVDESDLNIKPGTNRHRNVLAVMRAKDIKSAVAKLKTFSPKGTYADVRFCIERGYITLETPK